MGCDMKQNGFILIVSLIFLAIISMLGIAMFSGISMDETMSGNQREKSRSLDATQMTLDFVEYWLGQPVNTVLGGSLNSGLLCSSATVQPSICTNALANPATPANWAYSATFVSSAMSVNAAGGLNTYFSNPKYYIQFLGYVSGNTNSAMYQVTAAAQGGNNTATSVVQVVYLVTAKSLDISGS